MHSPPSMEQEYRCRLQFLTNRRKREIKRLKNLLRKLKLTPLFREMRTCDLDQCTDDLVAQCSSTKSSNRRDMSDVLLKLVSKKREYAIEYVARRQLVNTKNQVLKYIKDRFLKYRRNFQPTDCVSWVKDMPSRWNTKDSPFFSWYNLQHNKQHLHKLYSDAFSDLVSDLDILDTKSFTFKVACQLNKLAFCINAIDWDEYNTLNFLFRIYRTQQYSFSEMMSEILTSDTLPSPDAAVLHDHVLPVFQRINYFDYNDNTGAIKQSYDNALFLFRPELYPFLVAEYVMLRFLMKFSSAAVRETVEVVLKRVYSGNATGVKNICQCYPGAFTLLYLVYFEGNRQSDPQNVLNLLREAISSASLSDTTTKRLKVIAAFLCDTVYKLEQGKLRLSEYMFTHFASDLNFLKYSYFLEANPPQFQSLDNLPFLAR